MGGIARRATEIKDVRSQGLPLVVIDGGDFAPEYNKLGEIKFETLVESFLQMKYDAMSIGEREMLMQNDRYDAWAMLRASGIPVATLNLTYKGKRVRERPIIIDRGGVKVGLFGLFMGDNFPAGAGKEWGIEDTERVAEEALSYTEKNADLTVVMLSGEMSQARNLVKKHIGMDVVIVSHRSMESPQTLQLNNSLLVSAGTEGKYLGRVDASRAHGKWIFRGQFVALDKNISMDPVLTATYARYQERIEQFVKKSAGQVKEDLEQRFSPVYTANECQTCHGNVYDKWIATPHAHALDTLVEKDEQYNPECVGCHTTDYMKGGFISLETTPQYAGVQCVSCHGRMEGHIDVHSGKKEASEGEITKRPKVTQDTCLKCHTPERDNNFNFEVDKKEVH
jgi:2',3'-cyclic-nucleotide 2'-phosphodiesterase (5'-nucleotidase family)